MGLRNLTTVSDLLTLNAQSLHVCDAVGRAISPGRQLFLNSHFHWTVRSSGLSVTAEKQQSGFLKASIAFQPKWRCLMSFRWGRTGWQRLHSSMTDLKWNENKSVDLDKKEPINRVHFYSIEDMWVFLEETTDWHTVNARQITRNDLEHK